MTGFESTAAWWRPEAPPSVVAAAPAQAGTGRAAFAGLLAFTAILIVSPQAWVPALGSLRIALVAVAVAFLIYYTWPRLTQPERLMRLAVLALITAVAVVSGDVVRQATDVTSVTFRAADEAMLREYVATGEPMDKAGAYGIQGYGAALVDRIDGDFFGVMGLPVRLVLRLLSEAGWEYRFGARLPSAPGTPARRGGAP